MLAFSKNSGGRICEIVLNSGTTKLHQYGYGYVNRLFKEKEINLSSTNTRCTNFTSEKGENISSYFHNIIFAVVLNVLWWYCRPLTRVHRQVPYLSFPLSISAPLSEDLLFDSDMRSLQTLNWWNTNVFFLCKSYKLPTHGNYAQLSIMHII